MNGLAFCAGIGGLELGIKQCVPSYRTACYVEGEAHVAAVLVSRMQEGTLCKAPIWNDVRTFDARRWRDKVDIISAGYPCQPFSHCGKRQGDKDPRHLWPYIAKHIDVLRPSIVFCENVSNHLALGFEQVCEDLCAMGYSVEAGIFSAAQVGAQHLRKRLFFIAYTDSTSLRHTAYPRDDALSTFTGLNGTQGTVADTNSINRGTCNVEGDDIRRGTGTVSSGRVVAHSVATDSSENRFAYDWPTEPNVGRVANGVPFRVDRLRALGNAVVPATAALAFHTLTQKAMQ